ncbi:hypothetical protein B0H66DRAFT_549677 [Apodospora peruviana]|uniref:Nuclear pore complex protein Nup85 n=1 Tax=Apodospora peruviana TaxID=516989 RepID=A0AAE0IJE9_9PEZI|nr:hypothetical protein B0H66DRAFT_549677 [Apodospora peruviana]
MSSRFQVPGGSSSPPSTPDRSLRGGSKGYGSYLPYGENPSTTPAGPPPPSSGGSFTPAGAPSASYLGSSIMRGMTGPPKQPSFNANTTSSGSSSSNNNKNLFPQKRNAPPLGRSIRGGSRPLHQPSRLSRSVVPDEEENDEEEDAEGEEEEEPVVMKMRSAAPDRPGTFSIPFDDSYDEGDETDEVDGNEIRGGGMRGGFATSGAGEDMWLNMPEETPRRSGGGGFGGIGDESDLMMLATPAATERVRREAEDIFRASAMQSGGPRRRQHKFATLAKDIYNQMGTAAVTEPPRLILDTEALIDRLYDDGVGEADDEEKLDDTLATVAGKAAMLWRGYADKMPHSDEEHAVEIGPGPNASPFEKANYLANLVLQVHHTRYDQGGHVAVEPLPETLFRWQNDYHNLYGNQVEEILRQKPSPACHGLFWESIFIALLRGKVADAVKLLKQAGWGHVKRGQRGDYAYRGRALENVERAAEETVALLESCPGSDENWEIWSSDWTLFRVRAQGALEHLRRFAEGKEDAGQFGDSMFGDSTSTRGRQSMAGMARRAESQVPWDIYENLTIIFDIVLGSQTAILETAQDWCEATIGLLGWWDERLDPKGGMGVSSGGFSRSMALVPVSHATDTESYLDRLSRAFHVAVEAKFTFNALNPVEVGMACVFEDNIKAVVGILRGWSLPIASAVAEIASLGRWLPQHQPSGAYAMEDLDMDDLEVLGMDPGAPDEIDGIKDSTLVQYAQQLADLDDLSSVRDKSGTIRDGWELAIHVLGRMDSPERSEEMVGELVKHLIEGLHVDSEAAVNKIWTLLNELGMIPYAEETAETYGDILQRDSHRYGEAMWFFALAHRPNKVRDIMNLLISYSLVQSTVYPPSNDLDDHLHRLLSDRNETLKQCAKQDLEAAELLGKMLSGYASLRQFYEIRDGGESVLSSSATPTDRRRQAAAALVSVIASSDDNIRGGLFDQTRDGIVSEDFLLALLGEALVFVTNPDNANIHHGRNSSPIITIDQIDTILKAIEDLQAVGSRVYNACEEFLQLVLASAPLKGSTPADLLKSTSGGSFELTGSSLMASQLQRSLRGSTAPGGKISSVKRGWDWRAEVPAKTTGEDVMRRLRLGLAKDLASLWLAEADGDVVMSM